MDSDLLNEYIRVFVVVSGSSGTFYITMIGQTVTNFCWTKRSTYHLALFFAIPHAKHQQNLHTDLLLPCQTHTHTHKEDEEPLMMIETIKCNNRHNNNNNNTTTTTPPAPLSNSMDFADVESVKPRRPSAVIDVHDDVQGLQYNAAAADSSEEEEEEEDPSVFSQLARLSNNAVRPSSHKGIFTAVILLLGAAASAAFLCIGIISSMQEDKEQFEHEAEELAHSIKAAMQEYDLFGLWVHQACFRRAQRNPAIPITTDLAGHLGLCTRQEFADLYVHLNSRGANGLKFQSVQFMPQIYHYERQALEQEAAAYYAKHYPDYEYLGITDPQFNATTNQLMLLPRSNATVYWPVHYVEPLESNEAAVDLYGYAIASRAISLDKAVHSFAPTLSSGVRLVQETDPHARGLILRHPGVNASSVAPTTQPRAVSQIVLRVPDLLMRATSGIVVDKAVYLYDSTVDEDDEAAAAAATAEPSFLGAVRIRVVGHETHLTFLPEIALSQVPHPKGSHLFRQEIHVADRTWIVASISNDQERSGILYVVLGAAFIFFASVLLAIWFHSHMGRVAKWNALRAAAEEEKAKSAQRQVKRERQMNEFLSHEVSGSGKSVDILIHAHNPQARKNIVDSPCSLSIYLCIYLSIAMKVRNPLSSAISALSFVSSTMNDPNECQIPNPETRNTLQYDLRVMDASLQFINELLRNVLDVFRSASNQMKIELNPTDIRQDILEPVASILFLRGASSSAEVKVECPDDLVCQADRMRLKQIILNLVRFGSACVVDESCEHMRGVKLESNIHRVHDDGACKISSLSLSPFS